jgi:hypothetical protein
MPTLLTSMLTSHYSTTDRTCDDLLLGIEGSRQRVMPAVEESALTLLSPSPPEVEADAKGLIGGGSGS